MQKFKAVLDIIGINPFVFVPEKILKTLFAKAGKETAPIRIKGTVNEKSYKQSLVRYAGQWRLYINLQMLDNSPKRIGETIRVTIEYDPEERTIPFHPKLKAALNNNKKAKQVFDELSPSRRAEVNKYISFLKTDESIDRNIKRAIGYLLGENTFVGNYKIENSGKANKLSLRLASIVANLPLRNGIRVLEIGCGSGLTAKAIAQKIGKGHVTAIDRSAKAIAQTQKNCSEEITTGSINVKKVAIEDFALGKGEKKFDLIFAVRVGTLDGRHPEMEKQALSAIKKALKPNGQFFIDGGDPLKEIVLK